MLNEGVLHPTIPPEDDEELEEEELDEELEEEELLEELFKQLGITSQFSLPPS